MKCENCIHNEVCYKVKELNDVNEHINKLGCKNFQDKDKVIELPCKVGDTVYVIYDGYVTSALVLAFYIDCVGGMLDLKIKTKKETVTGFETIIDKDTYTFDYIYISREEAEKALKLKENGK